MQYNSSLKELTNAADRRKAFNDAKRREKAKTARDVQAMYDAILRAADFQPIERRSAWAADSLLWDSDNQDYDTPRPLALTVIGAPLTSKSEDAEDRAQTARNRLGRLFNHAIPRTGYQILTRYKSAEDEGKPHSYASHVLPVAVFFNELLDEQKVVILSDRQPKAQARIAEARERLAAEALEYLPKCDTELLDEAGELYAYVSAAEAQAYCRQNEGCSTRPLQYSEPEAKPKPKKPFYADDFDRLKKRAVSQAVDLILDAIGERNGKDTARAFWERELFPALEHAGERWVNYCRASDDDEEEEEEEDDRERENTGTNHVSEFTGVGVAEPVQADAENPAVDEGVPLYSLQGSDSVSGLDSNDLKNGGARAVNFDRPLKAALFYSQGGFPVRFPVLPVCQSKPGGGCSWDKHGRDCKGRIPLVKGGVEGGYSGASLDEEEITKWYTGQFAGQGVAIRLDGHVALDADVKDNGLESYAILRDTFGLEETLTQITHSGGAHFLFKLLEGLPAGWLKSWVRVGNKVGLPGLDLKVGVNGLLFVEPTIGPKGVYCWASIEARIATLPRECCDYLNKARYTQTPEEKAKAARASARIYTSSSDSRQFDHDQSKYFVDVPEGDRHARLLTVGNAIRRQTGASASQIAEALRYHAGRFSSPLNDERWIQRTSAALERGF